MQASLSITVIKCWHCLVLVQVPFKYCLISSYSSAVITEYFLESFFLKPILKKSSFLSPISAILICMFDHEKEKRATLT